jgi:CheY-like chemotaxis protein
MVIAEAAARSATADDLAASLALRSVLVVEDDPIFRAVFSRRFGLEARRVEAVADAASALAALEAGRWDVLCVDDGLPDRPGRELAAEIRRRRLPCDVILVTGIATTPDDPSLAGPGIDAILPKPCTDAELARAIRVACARQAARSSAPA